MLCIKGTGPWNIINWLTDLNVAPETLPSVGSVHGGFYLPSLSWLRLPISLRDHSRLRYLRTSQIAALGTEFD